MSWSTLPSSDVNQRIFSQLARFRILPNLRQWLLWGSLELCVGVVNQDAGPADGIAVQIFDVEIVNRVEERVKAYLLDPLGPSGARTGARRRFGDRPR